MSAPRLSAEDRATFLGALRDLTRSGTLVLPRCRVRYVRVGVSVRAGIGGRRQRARRRAMERRSQ